MNLIKGIGRAFCLSLAVLVLVSCGGSGSGSSSNTRGGFGTDSTNIEVGISVGQALLPLNPNLIPPSRGGPFTTSVTVTVTLNGLPIDNETLVQFTVVGPGALFCLLEDEEGRCFEVINGQNVQIGFAFFDFETSGGVAQMFFHAFDQPGTALITAQVTDPVSGRNQIVSTSVTIDQGNSTGQPAFISFLNSDAPLYVAGQGQIDLLPIQINVLDDGGFFIPNSGGNNLRVEILPGNPNGGERLVAIDAGGNTREGMVVNTKTLNGIAQVTLHSGALPGSVRIAATADRADNNVDNGIGQPVTDIETVTIGSSEIRTITFTGPYPGAVAGRQNTLVLGPFDQIFNGVYTRLFAVTTADQFGQPPPPGTQLAFFLGDSPLIGYPDQGRGDFVISGDDGNIEEGGFTFTTPATGSMFIGASQGCLLFYEGERPDRNGVRIITGVTGGFRSLSVNVPFNESADTGFTIPYKITCPPTNGNVEGIASGNNLIIQTDESGIASFVINYPITLLGRNFCLGAQANGGRAGAVLCHWYLGIADGSKLLLDGQEADIAATITVGETEIETVTVQLLDGNDPPSPLPAEVLAVSVVINDPDHVAAIEAREAAETAKIAADEAIDAAERFREQFFEDNDGVTNPDDPLNDPYCTTRQNPDNTPRVEPAECDVYEDLIQDAVDAAADAEQAEVDAVAAERQDALHNPTATFSPAVPVTGTDGLVDITLTVSDLPFDGSVEFAISTVGPEIIASTRKVVITADEGTGSTTP